MKPISEDQAIRSLSKRRNEFRRTIARVYESVAQSCMTCTTPGACCLDAHFVNVHISRLEAVEIRRIIEEMPVEIRVQVEQRINESIERYGLNDSGDTFSQTFACPLYDKQVGCLVHATAKPLPCIHHACYEKREDLPPEELLAAEEQAVERLNMRTYRNLQPWLPIPVAIRRVSQQQRPEKWYRGR